MQDIQPTGEGIGFLGANGGDRRIRQQNYHHQALKCPRCDSVNTKFCYYNNYNLSQPRHFCKKCRRYWTNGGVLRNVPVGGGCRKAKRSSKPKSPSFESTQPPPPRCERKSNSNSSSESTNLTAAVIATATAASVATEAVSAAPKLLTIHESKSFICQSEKANLKVASHFSKQGSELGIFSEIGSFTSLITSSNDDVLPFGFGNISNDRPFSLLHHDEVIQVQSQHNQWGITDALLNQTIQVDLSDSLHNRSSNVGFASLDFQGSDGDQELFDLPSAVDQAYWNQNQWPTDLHHHHHHHDHSNLYLP